MHPSSLLCSSTNLAERMASDRASCGAHACCPCCAWRSASPHVSADGSFPCPLSLGMSNRTGRLAASGCQQPTRGPTRGLWLQVTMSSLVNALELGGEWQEAIRMFQELKERGVQPNAICYNAAISALAKGSEVAIPLPTSSMRAAHPVCDQPALPLEPHDGLVWNAVLVADTAANTAFSRVCLVCERVEDCACLGWSPESELSR